MVKISQNYYADLTTIKAINPAYNVDICIGDNRYFFINILMAEILSLNSDNKINLFGFSSDYIEITLTKKSTSTLTIPEDSLSHSIVVQAEVNVVERDNYNEDTAKRTAVPDGTEVVFQIESSTGNAAINPSIAETKNGVAETNLAIQASEDTNKVDIKIVAYLNQ